MDSITEALGWLDKIEALSGAAITAFMCLVVGYALKFVKKFPNEGIPLAVILTGAIVRMLLADGAEPVASLRVWIFRNIFLGAIIGFLVWLLHAVALSRLEDWIAKRFPAIGDTAFFNKPAAPPAPVETETKAP